MIIIRLQLLPRIANLLYELQNLQRLHHTKTTIPTFDQIITKSSSTRSDSNRSFNISCRMVTRCEISGFWATRVTRGFSDPPVLSNQKTSIEENGAIPIAFSSTSFSVGMMLFSTSSPNCADDSNCSD